MIGPLDQMKGVGDGGGGTLGGSVNDGLMFELLILRHSILGG